MGGVHSVRIIKKVQNYCSAESHRLFCASALREYRDF
jgi:hypothetical protein